MRNDEVDLWYTGNRFCKENVYWVKIFVEPLENGLFFEITALFMLIRIFPWQEILIPVPYNVNQ